MSSFSGLPSTSSLNISFCFEINGVSSESSAYVSTLLTGALS